MKIFNGKLQLLSGAELLAWRIRHRWTDRGWAFRGVKRPGPPHPDRRSAGM